MSNKHTEPRHICPWCRKTFAARHGLKAHLRATRHEQFVKSQVRAAMQEYHQDKVALEEPND